jgi:cysteine desulfurase
MDRSHVTRASLGFEGDHRPNACTPNTPTSAPPISDLAQSGWINLDANANAAPTPAVIAAVVSALESGANPSSAHAAGAEARALLEDARDAVAGLCLNLFPEDVIFTSGCTEANNLIVATARDTGATLITTTVEHASLLRPAQILSNAGHPVRFLPVDAHGVVDLAVLADWLKELAGPAIVSVQSANSETGVMQPIEEIANLLAAHEHVLFHSDAAQSFGKGLTKVGADAGPDVVSISGHKLHAPMGVGALLLGEGETRLKALLCGGDQEGGLRAGTQPLPSIAGFAAACRERAAQTDDHIALMARLRNRLEDALTDGAPTARIIGGSTRRLPNVTNLCFPGIEAMSLVAHLDAGGVLISQGSACSSRRPEPSHVLTAMGLSESDAFACVRLSVSPLNTIEEIDTASAAIIAVLRRLESLA